MSDNSVKTEDIYLGNARGTWFVATRVTVVVLLMLAGIFGNGLVLLIYRRNRKQSGAVYIIALAVIDLFSCVCLLPQNPMLELSESLSWSLKIYIEKGFITIATSQYFSYLFVQLAMALDQAIAVFRPFKHKHIRKKIKQGDNYCRFSYYNPTKSCSRSAEPHSLAN